MWLAQWLLRNNPNQPRITSATTEAEEDQPIIATVTENVHQLTSKKGYTFK